MNTCSAPHLIDLIGRYLEPIDDEAELVIGFEVDFDESLAQYRLATRGCDTLESIRIIGPNAARSKSPRENHDCDDRQTDTAIQQLVRR